MTIKIVSVKELEETTVGSVPQGSAFRHDGVVYVKTDEGEDEPKCMSVTGVNPGFLERFDDSELVEPVTLEVAVILGEWAMTVKFIPKDEPDSLVRLNSLCAGAAFWHGGLLLIMSDEADCDLADEPYICLRPISGYLVRLSGDELVRLTTLELREV